MFVHSSFCLDLITDWLISFWGAMSHNCFPLCISSLCSTTLQVASLSLQPSSKQRICFPKIPTMLLNLRSALSLLSWLDRAHPKWLYFNILEPCWLTHTHYLVHKHSKMTNFYLWVSFSFFICAKQRWMSKLTWACKECKDLWRNLSSSTLYSQGFL